MNVVNIVVSLAVSAAFQNNKISSTSHVKMIEFKTEIEGKIF